MTSSTNATDSTPTGSGAINDTLNFTNGGSITYVVTGTVPSSASIGSLTDTVTVTAPGGINDPNTANNTAIASAVITNVADLEITNVNTGGATLAAAFVQPRRLDSQRTCMMASMPWEPDCESRG